MQENQRVLDELYNKQIENTILGFDIKDLSIPKSGVQLEDCCKCTRLFTVTDCGFQDDNVAFFWRMCKKSHNANSYCSGYDKTVNPAIMGPYRFCYNEEAISSIEDAIIQSDSVRAVDRACWQVLRVCKKRVKHHKKVDYEFILRNFNRASRSILSQRSSMWHDINEGIRRLLVMPVQKWKNEKQLEGTVLSQNGFSIRSLHGHQLRRLQREDRYNVTSQKPDLLVFGHYHLQMVLRKFDAWVLITGHWLLYPTPRRKGFLSQLGAPILTIDNSNEPHFRLMRYNDRKG